MKKIILTLIFVAVNATWANAESTLIEFKNAASAEFWRPVTDQATGGQSTAFMEVLKNKTAQISGDLRPANGDAYASYQASLPKGATWNFGDASKIIVQAQGDGKTYRIQIRDTAALNSKDDYAWEAELPTTPKMTKGSVAIDDLRAVAHGQIIDNVKPLDRAQIAQIGIAITGYKEAHFNVAIKSISVE